MGLFRAALTKKVIVVPGEFFDVNPGKRRQGRASRFRDYVRFSFGPSLDTVERALTRLEKLVANAPFGRLRRSTTTRQHGDRGRPRGAGRPQQPAQVALQAGAERIGERRSVRPGLLRGDAGALRSRRALGIGCAELHLTGSACRAGRALRRCQLRGDR